jgi:arylsulfatase A-like enzyme
MHWLADGKTSRIAGDHHTSATMSKADRPNIIVMLMDNLGYGDPGCYGSRLHRTPNIDRLAAEGLRLRSFYSTSGVCTPSRASLLTGCYPRRINLHCNHANLWVLFPLDHKGLNPSEFTIARLLQARDYATACIGKWHLGDQPEFLPTRHGFDEFFGIPYSEDMVPNPERPSWPPLPLMRKETVIEAPPDRDYLTRRYTEESIRFIREHAQQPFFLYLAQAMPGSCPEPFASPAFRGKSANGSYGDSVEELDWSAGAIMATLKQLGIDERTLVIWTSDNGAVRHDPPQGSNAPLRGWGYDTSEGAQRVPCLMRWPGRIPAGAVRDDVATMLDILPTAAALAGTAPPADRVIDGHDIRPLLFGRSDFVSPYDAAGFFYYDMHQLQAVRSGPWKLYLPLEKKFGISAEFSAGVKVGAELYDLRADIGETRNRAAERPEIVRRLTDLAEQARADLGDLGRNGLRQRPAGYVVRATPRLMDRTPPD